MAFHYGIKDTDVFETFVVLDLKSTGSEPEKDGMVEVAVLRVRDGEIVDSFSSRLIINSNGKQFKKSPRDPLSKGNQSFGQVSQQLQTFIGSSIVVGRDASLSLEFFARRGLKLSSPAVNVQEIASILVPSVPENFDEIAQSFGVRYSYSNSCLSNAKSVFMVFSALIEEGKRIHSFVLEELLRIARKTELSLRHLGPVLLSSGHGFTGSEKDSQFIGGLDRQSLETKLKNITPLGKPQNKLLPIPEKFLFETFPPGGLLSLSVSGYESRPQQEEMFHSIASAFYEGRNLIVEAGTGVGKSLAYLIPAAMFGLTNNVRILVSTNTINLQQQLLEKDLPLVQKALDDFGFENHASLRFSIQKGRANYLCFKRWTRLQSNPNISQEDGRFLGKTLNWMQGECSGDKSDIYLDPAELAVWEKTSAQGNLDCPMFSGPCFLRASRERAEGSHIVVVNHALLLADLKHHGALLPDYDYLIIDEAHHLEDEVTRQFGLTISQRHFSDIYDKIIGARGLVSESSLILRSFLSSNSRKESIEYAQRNLLQLVELNGSASKALFDEITNFMGQLEGADPDSRVQFVISSEVRQMTAWKLIARLSEKTALDSQKLLQGLNRFRNSIEALPSEDLTFAEGICSETNAVSEEITQIQATLSQMLLTPDDQMVYWFEQIDIESFAIHSAPLKVADILNEHLFQEKRSVILTSATLGVQGKFDSIQQNLGLCDADALALDSPFDYEQSALLCIPKDIPEPGSRDYFATLARTVEKVVEVASGRTMVLFTSYSSLRTTHSAVKEFLSEIGIRVLAQGIDGTPQQILKEFLKNPKTVLLGTSSFWEGIDLAGEALQVLILARLPFNVPTDPVFSARSQFYDNPFRDYALPQAVIRFRQGFGRLIRTKSDRGVVVVLDQRVMSRSYGRTFIRSLPNCTVSQLELDQLPEMIEEWLSR